jgi:type II secretory pathway component PulM
MNAIATTLTVRWQRLSTRERVGVALAATIVAAAFGWLAVWQPLTRDLAQTEREVREARARVAVAQMRIDEMASLARDARPPATADTKAAVLRTLAAAGLRSTGPSVETQDSGVRVTLPSIGLEALSPWLDVLAREEHLFPVEMTLTRLVEPGRMRVDVTLAR